MSKISKQARHRLNAFLFLPITLLACSALTGCIVAGASSTGGWFIWPGGLGLVVIVLLAIFLLRGRR